MNKFLNLITYVTVFLLLLYGVAADIEDDFDRADSSSLGTATNGNTWLVSGEQSTTFGINDSRMEYAYYTGAASNDNSYARLPLNITNPSRVDVIGWNVTNSQTGGNTQNYLLLTDSSGTIMIQLVFLNSGTGGLSYFSSGSWNAVGITLNQTQAYNISLRDIQSSTFDIYVDDVLYINNGNRRNTGTISNISIQNTEVSGAEMQVYISCITTGGTTCTAPTSTDYFSITVTDSYTGADVNNVTAYYYDSGELAALPAVYAFTNTSTTATYYTNYSTINTNQSYIWTVKHGFLSTYNITIPDSCINSVVQTRMYTTSTTTSQPQCFNSTDWVNIGSLGSGGGFSASGTVLDSNPTDWRDGNFSTGSAITLTAYDIRDNFIQGTSFGSSVYWDSVLYVNNTGYYSNSTGNIIYTNINQSAGSEIINITVTGNNYFNRTYTQYNTSSDLSAELHSSEVTFYAYNRVSNASITGLTASTTNNSATATNPTLNLSTGNYTATISKTGYYSNTATFTTTSLEQSSQNVSLYDHALNVTLSVTGTTDTESNFTVDVYGLDGLSGFHEQLNTTNGSIRFNLTDGNYTLWLNDSVHVLQSYNVTLNSSVNLTQYELTAANINQVELNFYDLDTLSLINTQNVNVSLVGSLGTYSANTSNGTVVLDLLNPDSYEVTATSANYSPATIYLTLNNDNATVNMYLDPTSLTDITFNVISSLGGDIYNSTLTFTRNINGSVVTVAQAKTDGFGQAVVALDPSATYFITVTAEDYATFEGSIKPIETSYTVTLEPSDSDPYISMFGYASIDVPDFVYNSTTDTLIITYDTVSSSGAISYFGMNTTYNLAAYGQNVTGSAGGGTVEFNISPANSSIQDKVTVDYWIKVSGYDVYEASATFYISEATPANSTVAGGLFPTDSEEGVSSTGLAFLGTIILLLAFAFVYNISGNLTAAAAGTVLIAGGLTFAGLFAFTYGVMLVIISLTIIIGDNT